MASAPLPDYAQFVVERKARITAVETSAPRATARPDLLSPFVGELVAAVPWGHHVNVLATGTDRATRLYSLEVEFALKTKGNPIGVAEYQLQPSLPAEFRGKLPTARQLSEAIPTVLPPGKTR